MKKQKISLKKTHTIIISDLHLGSSVSQPEKVLEMLKCYSFRKLILLGDIFDSLDLWTFFPRFTKTYLLHWENSQREKIRWVQGNHDAELAEFFSAFLGIKVYDKTYSWQYKEEKYLAIHGHQFDRFLINNKFLSHLATNIYNFIQKFDSKDKKISHYIKRKSKGWLRLSEKVYISAILYAKKHQAKYVFCGHTHRAMRKRKYGIKYYNTGCWTDVPCTYITIKENDVEICEY